tara:strand:- start:80 stop:253 length:174 start_codon:yes stop_codon:yes gene_type:complete
MINYIKENNPVRALLQYVQESEIPEMIMDEVYAGVFDFFGCFTTLKLIRLFKIFNFV